MTEPNPCTGLLSGNALCPNKPLLAIGGRLRFGDNCWGVKELLDPGNIPDVGVTWPDNEFEPKLLRAKPWFAILLGGCWKLRLAMATLKHFKQQKHSYFKMLHKLVTVEYTKY